MTAGRDRPARPLRRHRRPLPDHRGQPRRRHLQRRGLPRRRRRLRHRLGLERPHLPLRGAAQPRVQPAPRPPRPQRAGRRPAPRSAPRSTPPRSPAAPGRSQRPCGAIRPGALADLVAIDRDHVALAPLGDDQLLDGWIFAADDRVVREVWSAGRHVVHEGRHVGARRHRRPLPADHGRRAGPAVTA